MRGKKGTTQRIRSMSDNVTAVDKQEDRSKETDMTEKRGKEGQR